MLKLLERLRIDLWPLVKYEGTLLVARKETEIVTSRDGSSSSREFEIDRIYGTISGFRLFDPAMKSIANRMRSALHALRQVEFIETDVAGRIRTMSDEYRHQMATLMDKGLKSGRGTLSDLDELRRGMGITTTATLRKWSLEPGTKLPAFYIRREDSALYVGLSEYTATKINLNREFNNTIPEFTTLSLRPLINDLDGGQ